MLCWLLSMRLIWGFFPALRSVMLFPWENATENLFKRKLMYDWASFLHLWWLWQTLWLICLLWMQPYAERILSTTTTLIFPLLCLPQGWHSAHARDLLCLCLEMWKDLTIFRLKERLWKCQTRHVMVLFLWRKWTGERLLLATGGVFGSLISTPILNPPQSAILGLHAIKDRAVVINGKVCPQ